MFNCIPQILIFFMISFYFSSKYFLISCETSSLTHKLFKSIFNSQVLIIFVIYSLVLGHRRHFYFSFVFKFIKICYMTQDMVYLAVCCICTWENCVFFGYFWSVSFYLISWWCCLVQFYIFANSVYLFSWLLRLKCWSVQL